MSSLKTLSSFACGAHARRGNGTSENDPLRLWFSTRRCWYQPMGANPQPGIRFNRCRLIVCDCFALNRVFELGEAEAYDFPEHAIDLNVVRRSHLQDDTSDGFAFFFDQ